MQYSPSQSILLINADASTRKDWLSAYKQSARSNKGLLSDLWQFKRGLLLVDVIALLCTVTI